ncbi:MAG: sugar phosphate isomerase/epimerase [Actinobacteria bacterium]|nr:sugar phosphate isomerase/epimerase [Actinomycetota bacterium]
MIIPTIARPIRLSHFRKAGFGQSPEFRRFEAYDVILDDESMSDFDGYISELKSALADTGNGAAAVPDRYHLYSQLDIGHFDKVRARAAVAAYKDLITGISGRGGAYLTIHIGLNYGDDDLSFEDAKENLADLVRFAQNKEVNLCVENLRRGFTGNPYLFAELIEYSGAYVTFDIGHATSSLAAADGFGPTEFLELIADRVVNTHIYEYELDEVGHVAPEDLSVIGPVLARLQSTGCGWWVIELQEEELCRTRELVFELARDSVTGRKVRPLAGGLGPVGTTPYALTR